MWVRFCPGERFFFGLKKPIDNDGVALSRIPPGRARSFAIDYSRSGIDSQTCGYQERQLRCRREFSLDRRRIAVRAAVHHSKPPARLNLRQASKP
jgi:hypothetical protein